MNYEFEYGTKKAPRLATFVEFEAFPLLVPVHLLLSLLHAAWLHAPTTAMHRRRD
eukprot:COSAG02_NODE_1633_length_11567_cov_16.719567_8_plen_55_part_00